MKPRMWSTTQLVAMFMLFTMGRGVGIAMSEWLFR